MNYPHIKGIFLCLLVYSLLLRGLIVKKSYLCETGEISYVLFVGLLCVFFWKLNRIVCGSVNFSLSIKLIILTILTIETKAFLSI